MKNQKVNWIRVGIVSVWAVMMIATFFLGKVSRVELAYPGTGRFATSNIRYFLPYIPVVVFIFIFVLLFGRRGFCHRGCWISPIIAASTYLGRRLQIPSLHVVVQDPEGCRDCKVCNRNCPMSINVMTVVLNNSSLPNNCVQCGTCVDSCPRDVLKFNFGSEPFQPALPVTANSAKTI